MLRSFSLPGVEISCQGTTTTLINAPYYFSFAQSSGVFFVTIKFSGSITNIPQFLRHINDARLTIWPALFFYINVFHKH